MTDISDRLEAEITELQAVADRQRKLNDLPVVCRAISPLVTLLEDAHTTIRALTAGSETGERRVLLDVIAELQHARDKFPGPNVTALALMEEVGELATALFSESRERVRKEAIQVAVMAIRCILDGDQTLDDWRASKGLDPLTQGTSR